MQDACVKISSAGTSRTPCARSLYADLLCISLCQDLCIRTLYDHLCKISVCGSLVQDLSVSQDVGITTCERSLYADLLCKISVP